MDPFTMIAQIAANLAGWLQSGELGLDGPTALREPPELLGLSAAHDGQRLSSRI